MGNDVAVHLVTFPVMRLAFTDAARIKAHRRRTRFNVDPLVFDVNSEEVQVHHWRNEMRVAHRCTLLLNVAPCPKAHMLGKNECTVLNVTIEVTLRFQQLPTCLGEFGERISLDLRAEPGRFLPHHLAGLKLRFKRRVHEPYRSSPKPAPSFLTSREWRLLISAFAHATASSTSSSTASPCLCSS